MERAPTGAGAADAAPGALAWPGALAGTATENPPFQLAESKEIRHLRWRIFVDSERIPVLLYRGEERFLSDGILVLPVEDFLRALLPGRPPLAAF